jgi:hypothetical protein
MRSSSQRWRIATPMIIRYGEPASKQEETGKEWRKDMKKIRYCSVTKTKERICTRRVISCAELCDWAKQLRTEFSTGFSTTEVTGILEHCNSEE